MLKPNQGGGPKRRRWKVREALPSDPARWASALW